MQIVPLFLLTRNENLSFTTIGDISKSDLSLLKHSRMIHNKNIPTEKCWSHETDEKPLHHRLILGDCRVLSKKHVVNVERNYLSSPV